MKVILCLLGFTCLISSLTAYSFDLPLEIDEETKPLSQLEVIKNDEIIWYPSTARPTKPTVTTSAPSTSPVPTTTRRPSSTTTRRPRPPPPPPKPLPKPTGNIQIFDNANRSMGPLAARLINVLQNRRGKQNTIQSNGVRYNVGVMSPLPRFFDEVQEE